MTVCALALLLAAQPHLGDPAAAQPPLARPWDPAPRRRAPAPPPPDLATSVPPPPDGPAYYGYQTLIVHGLSGLATTTGFLFYADSENLGSVLIGVGTVGTTFGPALVHALHGHERSAVASAGINVGSLSLAGPGALLGGAIGDDGIGSAFWGAIGAASAAKLAAIVLDATWLGYGDTPEDEKIVWAPAVTYGRDGERWAGVTVGF